MLFKSVLIAGSALLACTAFAQESLGTVGNVQGTVLSVDGSTSSSLVPGKVIHNGEVFTTTGGGSVTLNLPNGCTLTLQPNQTLTVDAGKSCQALRDSIRPTGFAGGGGGGLGFGGAIGGLGGIAGLGLLGYGLHKGLDKHPNGVIIPNPNVSGL